MIRRRTIVVVGVLIVLVALASQKTYRIGESADGTLMWNADEAYLFLNVGYRGYRLNYVQTLLEMVREYFGAVRPPDDQSFWVEILRITPKAIEHHTEEGKSLDLYTPFQGSIYANNQGTPWRWSGTRFEVPGPQEQKELDGIKRLSATDFSNSNGWSKRGGILSRSEDEVKYNIVIGGKPLVLDVKRRSPETSIDVRLLRPDGTADTVWYADLHPRKVRKEEYQPTFKQ